MRSFIKEFGRAFARKLGLNLLVWGLVIYSVHMLYIPVHIYLNTGR
jgi:hypothetical protein